MEADEAATRIPEAIDLVTAHIETHSPAKPLTLERYKEVLGHFERLLGKKKYVQAINRVDVGGGKRGRRSGPRASGFTHSW